MRTVERDKLLQHYEVIDGAAIGPDRAVICALFLPAMEAGEAVSQVFWYESGEWHVGPMIGIECASLAWDPKTQSALVLGREGNLMRIKDDAVLEESVVGDELSIGPFRRVRIVGDDVLVVGDDRGIYRWTHGHSERLVEAPNRPELSADSEEQFVDSLIDDAQLVFDIDGTSAEQLIAVGSDGGLWRLHDKRLIALDSPTNLPLYSICRCDAARYCVGGREGLVLKGNETGWSEFAIVDGAGDLPSVARFRDSIYVCDGHQIFVSPVDEADFQVVTVMGRLIASHALRAHEASLLSIAGKEIFATSDGVQWTQLL
jgi:hypothetical protein